MLETCSALADAGRPICLGGTSAERGKTHRSVSKHYDNLTFCASEKIGDFRRHFDFLPMVPTKVGLVLSKETINEGTQIVGTALWFPLSIPVLQLF